MTATSLLRPAFLFLFVSLYFCAASRIPAAEVKSETVKAWNDYVQRQQQLTKQDAQDGEISLVLDRSPDLRARLQAGEIVVYPAQKKGVVPVPSGLIHDWVGLIFLPRTSLDHILTETRTYRRYPEFYPPSVMTASLIEQRADFDRFSLLMRQQVLSIHAALYGEYHTDFWRAGQGRWYSFTQSDRLQEIIRFGETDEKRLPSDHGNGFIWRIHSAARYEEADGGVYVQLEAVALSRTVPWSLAWFVNPVVARISKAAITSTLRQTRDGMCKPQELAAR